MSKASRQKREHKPKNKETLVSITAETQRVTVEEQQHHYEYNTSEKLIERYDPELGRMRIETDVERRDRILSNPMEVKAKVGKTTSLIAREINERNVIQPVKITPSPKSYKQSTQVPHPLWRKPSLIPSPRSSLGRSLETDKFGFHPDIINDICTRKGRYYTNTEKVFLTTQVNLMLSLSSSNRNNQRDLVKDICKRMGIRNSDIPDKNLWKQLSANIRNWSDKFEIQPVWEGTDSSDSVTALDDKIRKQLKEDFDLFTGYSFTQRESAELANAIHGTDRAGNTIAEWAADGTPRDRKDSTTITKEESVPTVAKIRNYAYKDDQVSTPEKTFYPTDAKYWVTSKGEPCADCGHPHCQDNLVDMPSVMLKFIRAIKDGVLDWRRLIEDDVRDEVASKNEDEAKVLRLELSEIERQLASAKNDNQTLAKQLEVVKRTTSEKEKEIKDVFS